MVQSNVEYIQNKLEVSKYLRDKLFKSISDANDKDFILSMLIEEFEEGNLQSEKDVLTSLVNGSFPASMLAPLLGTEIDDQSLEDILVLIEDCQDPYNPANGGGENSENEENDESKMLLDDLRDLAGKIWFGTKSTTNKSAEHVMYQGIIKLMPPEDDDDEDLGEGCCELCERENIHLTKHHLRPREVHEKLLKRYGPKGSETIKKQKHSTEDVVVLTQEILNITANICRPCHNAVHRSHDNETLAESFYTIDLLLTSEKVSKYVKFSSKQKVAHHFHGLKYK